MDRRSFEIRFESIGGLGADAAAQALAAAAVLKMGLSGTHSASRRPERKGAPVRSFVRLAPADRPIRASAPVETPDAVVLFHAPLMRQPQVFAGLRKDGTFIFSAPPRFDAGALAALPATARAIRVDALAIASKEKSCTGAVLLGTLCGAFAFLDAEKVLEAFCEVLAAQGEEALTAHRGAFRRGAAELQTLDGVGEAEGDLPAVRAEPAWGYETQPLGGVMPLPGNTAWNDLSARRSGLLPAFNRERCIHCALCEIVCPDFCLVWEKGEEGGRFERELTGVDYRYCKGCLRCVESCPASAMLRKAETPGFADQRCVPLFPDLVA